MNFTNSISVHVSPRDQAETLCRVCTQSVGMGYGEGIHVSEWAMVSGSGLTHSLAAGTFGITVPGLPRAGTCCCQLRWPIAGSLWAVIWPPRAMSTEHRWSTDTWHQKLIRSLDNSKWSSACLLQERDFQRLTWPQMQNHHVTPSVVLQLDSASESTRRFHVVTLQSGSSIYWTACGGESQSSTPGPCDHWRMSFANLGSGLLNIYLLICTYSYCLSVCLSVNRYLCTDLDLVIDML